jgi:hypothetical protein
MFEVFSRSWNITKLSFRVILQDKEMLLFPLLAGVFSLLFSVALIFPTLLVGADTGSAAGMGIVDYVILAITYFGLAFIATFFNVCVVYTTKTRFEGGDATFMDSVRFALSRVHLIAAWSALAATVGLLLRALDQLAERMGGVGEIILSIVTSLVGMAWSVVTLFVVPSMVYHDLGPGDALKRSVQTLRETWGESLIRHFGLGLMQFLFILPGILLALVLFSLLGGMGTAGLLVALLLSGGYILGVVLVFNVANNVFNTALFVYAEQGVLPSGFDEDTMRGAFRYRSQPRMAL